MPTINAFLQHEVRCLQLDKHPIVLLITLKLLQSHYASNPANQAGCRNH